MKRFRRSDILCLVSTLLPGIRAQAPHPFNVEDDIAMVRFSDPRPQPGVLGSEIAKQSPDGRYLAIVTSRGLLASDRIESRLSVFDVQQLTKFLRVTGTMKPRPRLIASVISFPHREQTSGYAAVITDVRWSPDGSQVLYKAENLEGRFQLCIARVDTANVMTLSPPSEDVDQFDMVGDTIVYSASSLNDHTVQPEQTINADARVATGLLLNQILFPRELAQNFPQTYRLKVLQHIHGGWVHRSVPRFSMLARSYLSDLIPFKLSPDAKKLLTLTPVRTIPRAWEQLEPAQGYEHTRFRSGDAALTDPMNPSSPRRYVVINLGTGTETPLVRTPEARSLGYFQPQQVLWSWDSRDALVTNAFTHMANGQPSALDTRTPCALLGVPLATLEARCILRASSDLPWNAIERFSFGQDAEEVIARLKRNSKPAQVETYRLINGSWKLVASNPADKPDSVPDTVETRSPKLQNPISVAVRQNLNKPPALWAEDHNSGLSLLLWDPNPQFRFVRFAPASLYHWTDQTGYQWTAEMITPLDYVPGTKYPLVLQMYSFDAGQFVTDGLEPSAFVARQLGSVGFFVLQIKKKPNTFSEADPQSSLEGYRSAIEALAKQGLIDPGRVGVVGFSWTCWYAVNALVHEPRMFAAATVSDGFHYSYMQYLLFAPDAAAIRRQMEAVRGGGPFGDDAKRWIAESPNFHFDRVQTPLRIEAMNPSSVLQEWDLYSSLRLQHKPVDLIYFPRGTHIHQKPLERFESQQGDVDWFRFWLQDYEDPSQSKAAQYARWRELKQLVTEHRESPSEP